jgi:hypothetical protein
LLLHPQPVNKCLLAGRHPAEGTEDTSERRRRQHRATPRRARFSQGGLIISGGLESERLPGGNRRLVTCGQRKDFLGPLPVPRNSAPSSQKDEVNSSRDLLPIPQTLVMAFWPPRPLVSGDSLLYSLCNVLHCHLTTSCFRVILIWKTLNTPP